MPSSQQDPSKPCKRVGGTSANVVPAVDTHSVLGRVGRRCSQWHPRQMCPVGDTREIDRQGVPCHCVLRIGTPLTWKAQQQQQQRQMLIRINLVYIIIFQSWTVWHTHKSEEEARIWRMRTRTNGSGNLWMWLVNKSRFMSMVVIIISLHNCGTVAGVVCSVFIRLHAYCVEDGLNE